jgi:hypothetical protein
VIHRRTIAWEKGGYWLFLDQLFGGGGVAFAGFVHVDPSLSLRLAAGLTWQVEGLSQAVWLSAAGGVSAELVRGRREPPEQGWQSERFGELTPNQVLVLRRDAELPAAIAYAIALDEPVTVEFAGPPDRLQLRASHRGVIHSYPLGTMVGRHR